MDIHYLEAQLGRHWISESKEISAMLSALMKTKQQFLNKSIS